MVTTTVTATSTSTIGYGDGERRHGDVSLRFSLRRAAANGADAIPPNSSSRSIEVHGRKQAPFYPVHSAATRKVDGRRGAPRATGRESVYALLSSLALSLSPFRSLALSLFLSLSLPYTPLRVPTRVAAPYIYYVSPEEFTRIVHAARPDINDT